MDKYMKKSDVIAYIRNEAKEAQMSLKISPPPTLCLYNMGGGLMITIISNARSAA